MGKIIITISPLGELKVEAENFTGSSCEEKTAFLKALGQVTEQEYKPEYYMEEEKEGEYNA